MVFGLLPLIILGVLIYAIVAALRGRGTRAAGEGGVVSIRRLFQYALLLAALIVASIGMSQILGRVIGGAAARRGSELAAALALASVGVPVFWGLAVALWRRLADAKERASVAWSLYLNVTLIGFLATAAGFSFAVANEFVEGDGYDGTLVAPLLVTGAVWALHFEGWRRRPPVRAPMAHVYINAAIGLFAIATGAGFAIAYGVEQIFEEAVAARSSGDDLARAIIALAIGTIIWSWHWLGISIRAVRDSGWHAYVMLIGIFGGLVVAVTGGAGGLYLVLEWLFGDTGDASAAEHFRDLAPALAMAIVGGAVWFYHRAVLALDPSRERTEIDRVYDHILSGVALVTIATALTILVVAVFEAFRVETAVRAEASDINTVLGAITGLVVGVPIWLVAWGRAQRAVAQDPKTEASSPTRRMYLFAVFGVGGAIAFGALIRLLIVIYEELFDEGSSQLTQDVSVPIALLITVGTIAAYHWFVYRNERVETAPRRDVLLVWPAAARIPDFSVRPELRVDVLRRTDLDAMPTPTAEDVLSALDTTDAERILLVVGPDGPEAMPLASE